MVNSPQGHKYMYLDRNIYKEKKERMYGKIVDGNFQSATSRIKLGDEQIINPTEADLIAAGYKPVELATTAPMSETVQPVYTEQNGKIVQTWSEG